MNQIEITKLKKYNEEMQEILDNNKYITEDERAMLEERIYINDMHIEKWTDEHIEKQRKSLK